VRRILRLLRSISSHPTGAVKQRAVLKTVILLVAEYGSTEWDINLHFPSWNADGVRSRKLEMEHFLKQHGVDICLLNETFLNPGQVNRLAIYRYHRKDRLKWGAVQPSWNAVV